MKKGRFITIEGGEGAGKTTLIEELARLLIEQGYRVLTTREPGGIPIAEQIRSVILDKLNTKMDARTEALLYAAARRQHLIEKVIPALDEGMFVICDRFVDSSLAYQGYARELGIEAVRSINDFAIDGRMPELTLWLDISPEAGLARIQEAAGREINRLDLEGLSFHRLVRDGYIELMKRDPDRIIRIDAENEPNVVLNEAISIINERFRGLYASDVKMI
ncbi:thymidylate kinase [Paenibacillus baekrokdamisoli]|uniref:Thymidylate kinase n=1 Tax=Paenibacillus baekrokdamisoli TaxID=1712516 RepID=A0A3G9IYF6_9BACL|nr:dTMP kinase [Paenibacillus baekrokdamisoli]MBB3072958.1 dTMP kinase [Paenibacillus baekrokdamisoli]BBH23372.1 thymidylate kinase [Paenibacillus baekrokdamisoli]